MKSGNFAKKSRIDFSKTHSGNKSDALQTMSDMDSNNKHKTELNKETRESNSEEKVNSSRPQRLNKTIEPNSKSNFKLKSKL